MVVKSKNIRIAPSSFFVSVFVIFLLLPCFAMPLPQLTRRSTIAPIDLVKSEMKQLKRELLRAGKFSFVSCLLVILFLGRSRSQSVLVSFFLSSSLPPVFRCRFCYFISLVPRPPSHIVHPSGASFRIKAEEIKRIQSVPLVIGQFNELIDSNYGVVSSTAGSNYYVRILSTIDREDLKVSMFYCCLVHGGGSI